MTVKNFFEFTQIQTTFPTILTVLFGMAYGWYNYQVFHPLLSLLAILLVLLFLVAINIRDHYVDYQVAAKKDSPLVKTMIIGRENLSLKYVRWTYLFLGVLAALIILYLTIQTTLFLFYAALVSFLIGVFYAAGPLPISSTPTGEVFTGIAMGFGVFFAGFYVNTFEIFTFTWQEWLQLVLASTPTTIAAMNIVFANNICDLEEDLEDNRYTLPSYIGIDQSLILYQMLYYVSYLSIVASVVLGVMPMLTLLALFSIPFIQKNIQAFKSDQNKELGLRLAVINAVILPATILIPFALHLLAFS